MWTCRFWDAILVFTYETGKKGGEENKMIRNSLSLYVNTGDKEMNYIHRVLCRLILAQLKR